MKQAFFIFSTFGLLITSIINLYANVTFFKCPSPNDIKIEGTHWTVTESPVGSWTGSGGEKVGPLERTDLFVSDQQTEMSCTYQSGSSHGTINAVTPQLCAFDSGFSHGETECMGADCTIACTSPSEVATVTASCKGYKVGTSFTYDCFKAFYNQTIVNRWTVIAKGTGSQNGDSINITLNVKGRTICLDGMNATIPYKPNSKSYIIKYWSEWGYNISLTFFLADENGRCP